MHYTIPVTISATLPGYNTHPPQGIRFFRPCAPGAGCSAPSCTWFCILRRCMLIPFPAPSSLRHFLSGVVTPGATPPTESVTFSFILPAQPDTESPIDTNTVEVEGIGKVDIGEVMETPGGRLEIAFDIKMRVIAYWKVVIQRIGDGIPLHLQFVCQNLIRNDLDEEIVKELSGTDLSKALGVIMEESPRISARRENLKKSVHSLIESQKEVAEIIDQLGEVQ